MIFALQAVDGLGVGVMFVRLGERPPRGVRRARGFDYRRGGVGGPRRRRMAAIAHDFTSDAGTNSSAQVSSSARACVRYMRNAWATMSATP